MRFRRTKKKTCQKVLISRRSYKIINLSIVASTIYALDIEDEAMKQFEDAMAQPFVKGGALMPDAHTGYSLPIGAVVATRGVVVPAWVGFDIGCGVCAMNTGLHISDILGKEKEIFNEILRTIPIGE